MSWDFFFFFCSFCVVIISILTSVYCLQHSWFVHLFLLVVCCRFSFSIWSFLLQTCCSFQAISWVSQSKTIHCPPIFSLFRLGVLFLNKEWLFDAQAMSGLLNVLSLIYMNSSFCGLWALATSACLGYFVCCLIRTDLFYIATVLEHLLAEC